MQLFPAGQRQGSWAKYLAGNTQVRVCVPEASQGQRGTFGHAPATCLGEGDRRPVTELCLKCVQLVGLEKYQWQVVTRGELLQARLVGFTGDAGNAAQRFGLQPMKG